MRTASSIDSTRALTARLPSLVWVRSAGPGRSSMRVSFGEGTNPEAEPVSRFAAQVQERVMMASEPGRASR